MCTQALYGGIHEFVFVNMLSFCITKRVCIHVLVLAFAKKMRAVKDSNPRVALRNFFERCTNRCANSPWCLNCNVTWCCFVCTQALYGGIHEFVFVNMLSFCITTV